MRSAQLQRWLRELACVLICALAGPVSVFAAGTGSQNSPTFSPGFLIAWLVCNSRKRNPIGGWLFFFYWQLYSGLLMTGVFFATNLQSYVPENFASTSQFALFLASAVPGLLLFVIKLAVATILLSARTWDMLKLLPEREYLYNEFRLKIMTFDTCQGEERDLIFYSMVANADLDKLWGVFIKDLASVDLEEDGKIKAQRLNVGFSRAKESVHLVLSKPLDKYSGAIGEALRHFWSVYSEAKIEHTATEVDPRSVREAEVLNWFYQTKFWREEKERSTFTPQFELGRYLKQLDPYYEHPQYRVDFLLLYCPDANTEKKIIIEYDGFKEHFGEGIGIDSSNYTEYYSEEDVYRQKVLEGYGYKFLRVNRFNLGENPIATLDARLLRLVANKGDVAHNHVLDAIQSDIRKLQDGGLKECPKCKELRSIDEFKDMSLASGVGRFCQFCKAIKRVRTPNARLSTPASPTPNPCPTCGSRMALRTGRFGKFYGCSKYPYCRATRPYVVSTIRASVL